MIQATSLDFVKDCSEFKYGNECYDLHNNYRCNKMIYTDETLCLLLVNEKTTEKLSVKFTKAIITHMETFNIAEVESLTVDALYRGRFELNGHLVEASADNKAYFYLEFDEGQKLEFWAYGVTLQAG